MTNEKREIRGRMADGVFGRDYDETVTYDELVDLVESCKFNLKPEDDVEEIADIIWMESDI